MEGADARHALAAAGEKDAGEVVTRHEAERDREQHQRMDELNARRGANGGQNIAKADAPECAAQTDDNPRQDNKTQHRWHIFERALFHGGGRAGG
ncbi:hypothetical protein GCM10010909_05930 [Acidocella aquatica]|uniref:Uncharacterized protein n=1 Tax=Acidocella aquatica TaxID=1922313 RepID=A0ABQ6A763_9PROT|nr:hypothetical protein GCM10010909_05930 [Acidocella aquatica]